MKLRHIFLAIIVSLSFNAFSQNCNEGSLMQQPGTWKEGIKGSTSGIPATELAAERKVVAAVHGMIKSKYIPKAVEVNFNSVFGYPVSGRPANDYGYSVHLLNFYCDGVNLKTADETSTYFSISANLFDAEIYENASDESLEGFHFISDLPVQKDGYFHFHEIDASLGMGVTGRSSTWLITYDGELPFAYVSKKEFLEKRKKILANQMVLSASSSKDVLANIEIEKKYKEAEYKNDPDKFQKYLKMDYIPVKERYEKLLTENEKQYSPAFSKIEAQLKMSEAELSEVAIVKVDPRDYLSYLFTNDEDPFGKILIKPNPAYFKNLPKSSPQFFSVFVRGNPKDPVAMRAMTDIKSAVDFTVLRNMLGK